MALHVKTLATYLDSLAIGSLTAGSWRIFAAKMPKEPDQTISVFAAGGKDANPKWLIDYPTLNVRVRGAPNDWEAPMTKMLAIKDALLGLPGQDLSGDRWVGINMQGDIKDMGIDDLGRYMISADFSCIVEPASGTNRSSL